MPSAPAISTVNPIVLLVDNGSIRADATLGLRKLAEDLGNKTPFAVHPVSLKHSDSISADKLNGKSAQTFRFFLKYKLLEGQRSFIVLPLFFGESKALTSFLPEEVNQLKREFGEFDLKVAKVLFSITDNDAVSLAGILYDHVVSTAKYHKLTLENIVLVDHGSPSPEVTRVRQSLAELVQTKLDVRIDQAAMERREGKKYDFNGELLEKYLVEKATSGETQAIVIMQFFLSGRHAGKEGDIVKICDSVMQKYPDFKVFISPLISEHPSLVLLLERRINAVLV